MKYASLLTLVLILLSIGACAPQADSAPLPSETAAPLATATPMPPTETYRPLNRIVIPAPSLANNLLDEPLEQVIYVYLPPSYNTSTKRYPVVYYLPGYGDRSMIGFVLPVDMDALIAAGAVNEMILVVPHGVNVLGGSFYVNSPVTGNWEDYIVRDVVGYVDGHFRTLAQAESRGISGHSMGGYGALNLAMLHPEVFGAVYSFSPGLFDENGLAESQMFSSETQVQIFAEFHGGLAGVPLEEAKRKMMRSPQQFSLSYGAAFSPDAAGDPPYFTYPYLLVDGQLVRDDAIWAQWESGFGGIAQEAVQYRDNWLKLKGIVVDYGVNDEFGWIPKGCAYFGQQMTAAGIPVKVEVYDGTHQSKLGERVRQFMLPFFSTTLTFE